MIYQNDISMQVCALNLMRWEAVRIGPPMTMRLQQKLDKVCVWTRAPVHMCMCVHVCLSVQRKIFLKLFAQLYQLPSELEVIMEPVPSNACSASSWGADFSSGHSP